MAKALDSDNMADLPSKMTRMSLSERERIAKKEIKQLEQEQHVEELEKTLERLRRDWDACRRCEQPKIEQDDDDHSDKDGDLDMSDERILVPKPTTGYSSCGASRSSISYRRNP